MSGIIDVAGIPPEFSREFDLSYQGIIKMLRAARALVLCTAVHNEHPVALIARASRGDRRAVLDLIKIDPLFMNDVCCSDVIKRAALQEDGQFLQQIKRAIGYQPKLHSRDIKHVYYYILFTLENLGFRLPALEELWNTIDPRGGEYDKLLAFERDFQRQRQAFLRMRRRPRKKSPSSGEAARHPLRWQKQRQNLDRLPHCKTVRW
jgi:hypothetical protein